MKEVVIGHPCRLQLVDLNCCVLVGRADPCVSNDCHGVNYLLRANVHRHYLTLSSQVNGYVRKRLP
ncbi:hypothetical protein MES4922_100110 [Mesorhizobium ventifaucium]|uniref:Uncharacterized protein n=1 Tax=Mesorhizobium ventifaucium TaxID=666020 RepID=A0ABM9DD97_9HYPH|nr:hypothetical protein MES4922_100110 [Mesorhizobium ventifaucium]